MHYLETSLVLFLKPIMPKLVLVLSTIIAILGVAIYLKNGKTEIPKMDLNAWWGPGDQENQDTSIRPFRIKFTEAMIKDLRDRLFKHVPLTPTLEGTSMEYGMNTRVLEDLLKYWIHKYPFEKREKFFNQYPQFKTNVQGLDIHFIHIKPEVPNKTVVPVLMMHGWPGSIREFYEAIPLLTAASDQRDFAVELIIPSLPGYGFSSPAVRPGLGAAEVGVVMRNLMHRLGHKKFYIQGGDWGSLIGTAMATLFPEEILGFHSNMPFVNAPLPTFLTILGSIYPPLIVEKELAGRMYPLTDFYSKLLEMTGYMHLQATKPDTIGTALNDSPTGLAAYIVEKFITWTLPESATIPEAFSLDGLLDNLMMYWAPGCIASSVRLYAESASLREMALGLDSIPTPVPTWVIQAKNEISYQSPFLLRFKFTNLLHATVLDEGGHFLAFELPEVFAGDVLEALTAFRKVSSK